MNLIRLAIERPIAVTAAVLLIVILGIVALNSIPIQLTPDVQRPVITVNTTWHGAAPAEIEREIIIQQEEVLKGIEGLENMKSTSEDGRGEITLEFNIGQDMNRALLLVANRLDRVSDYPEEADEPVLDTSGSEDRPIAWWHLKRLPGNDRPVESYGDFMEDVIEAQIERVPGVSRVNRWGGTDRELRVTVDPNKMALYGITVPEINNRLRLENAAISAGDLDEGKRRYIVRTEGDFTRPEQVEQVVLRTVADAGGRIARVTIGDIGTVEFANKDRTFDIRRQGHTELAINVIRETGANVIETMNGLRAAENYLNENILPAAGLEMIQVYDETVYINSAIELVQQNIYVGGTLAALMLLLFLRSVRATLVVSLAIPVSVIGAFVAMAALGRSINVISLAGIAFAIGLVVDAAIVVLENIFRLRQEGKPVAIAAYEGARQVWAAVFVSAMTTVLVFVPVLIMEMEVGQLFRDIAVAISVAVLLSLLVAATLIPALANRLLRAPVNSKARMQIPVIDNFARAFVDGVLRLTRWVLESKLRGIAMVGGITLAAIITTWAFLPKLEYLPEGDRNLLFGLILPPPGYNLDTMAEIANRLESTLAPYWAEDYVETDETPPKIDQFFFVAGSSQTLLGAVTVNPHRIKDIIPYIAGPAFSEPGTFGFVKQPSLFERSLSGGRSIELNISGPDLERNLMVAVQAVGMIERILPRAEGNQLRPIPGLELGAPEIRLTPDRVRLTDNGVTARELGETIDAFNDGMRVAEITVDGKRIDLTLRGTDEAEERTQSIAEIPVVTASGTIVPAGSLSDIEVTVGPVEIRHLEQVRTVTLEILPTNRIPLESALEMVKKDVVEPLETAGLPNNVSLSLSGTADKLTETWDAVVVELALAVLIVYLVMAVLFESFVYPLIILFSVPLATAGGILGLGILNFFSFQPLDMLTMLGFVILIGIVVNNAILLVHQTLHHIRSEGKKAEESILLATRHRIRPIFMSTLTSVFGMLPLVLFPGAGSELYRGLGSVVVGGLSLSAVLTLTIIPPLLGAVVSFGEREHQQLEGDTVPEAAE